MSPNYNYFNEEYRKVLEGESNRKVAFYVSESVHASLNSTFRNSLEILKNEKLKFLRMFSFNRNNMMIEHLSDILGKFHPMGITKYHIEYEKWLKTRPPSVDIEDSRKVLSMTDLEFYFVIWVPCLFVAFVVFIFEIRSLWMKRQL